MHKFFADASEIGAHTISLTGDDAAHISRVLRLSENDAVVVCDGNCTDYLCTILSVEKGRVSLSIQQTMQNHTECPLSITLYQSIPKSDKMDYIIQKSVELGVTEIVPVVTERTVVKVRDADRKRERWQKIALEAAKQCGRGRVPKIGEVCSFAEAIDCEGGFKLFPYENERQVSIKTVLRQADAPREVSLMVGPEGGFSEQEADAASANGWQLVGLGPRILRCETAPIAAITAILYEIGDW